MNLLERMAEALRHEHEGNKDALASLMERGIYDGVDDDAKRQMDEVDALLAEYERVRVRTVVLTFEPLRETEKYGGPMLVLVDHSSPLAEVYVRARMKDGDYAYAVLPPLPGPEVFKEETT